MTLHRRDEAFTPHLPCSFIINIHYATVSFTDPVLSIAILVMLIDAVGTKSIVSSLAIVEVTMYCPGVVVYSVTVVIVFVTPFEPRCTKSSFTSPDTELCAISPDTERFLTVITVPVAKVSVAVKSTL